MEFARHEALLIDRLLNGPTYDEVPARQIIFNEEVDWGYQKYVDILKVAWSLNHQLPTKSRRFRILGVNCSPDWSVLQKEGQHAILDRYFDEGERNWDVLGTALTNYHRTLSTYVTEYRRCGFTTEKLIEPTIDPARI